MHACTHHACIEYLTKYASDIKDLSTVAREAFVQVMNNETEATSEGMIKILTNTFLEKKLLLCMSFCIRC